MTEVHYGVVRIGDHWSIVGDNLRFGHYATRFEASDAALRLAEQSSGMGVPVRLHVQEDDFILPSPTVLY